MFIQFMYLHIYSWVHLCFQLNGTIFIIHRCLPLSSRNSNGSHFQCVAYLGEAEGSCRTVLERHAENDVYRERGTMGRLFDTAAGSKDPPPTARVHAAGTARQEREPIGGVGGGMDRG